ncbi:MAG: molecular chaperone TorD family protein [Desulfomonilaceae bacterium]|nr:molecular chaperone TorD family protein [Desulfomonilaceae bacterium]
MNHQSGAAYIGDTCGGPHIDDPVQAVVALARLFGSSEPLGQAEAEETVDVLARVPAGCFGEYRDDPARFVDAWNRVRDLFKGLPKVLPLEESFYKEWTSDRSHPLVGRKGLAWGDPAAHVLAMFNEFGIALRAEDPRSPDHIAVLLEFLAFLMENRPTEEAQAFCRDHLDWLPDLRREATVRGFEGVFQHMVLTVESLVHYITTIQERGGRHG